MTEIFVINFCDIPRFDNSFIIATHGPLSDPVLETGRTKFITTIKLPRSSLHSYAEGSLIIMFRFKRLFGQKSQSKVLTRNSTNSSTTQAPVPEDDSQHEPPPYSASSTTQPDQNTAPQATTTQEQPLVGLLDPSLNFTAAQMEQQWRVKDKIFARAIVHFIAERFDGNLRSWAGYKYTYINNVSSRKPDLPLNTLPFVTLT